VSGVGLLTLEMLALEILLNGLHNVVADEFLRLLVGEDVSATFNADCRHAFDVVFKCVKEVFNRLLIRLVIHSLHLLQDVMRFLCKHLSCDLSHFLAMFFGSATMPILCEVISCDKVGVGFVVLVINVV
jgi:hypothetical protein